jgi:hypothetical protein
MRRRPYVSSATSVKAETLTRKVEFRAPRREAIRKGPRTVKIQYSKPLKDVAFLEEALNLASARAVGMRTFDIVLKSQRAK